MKILNLLTVFVFLILFASCGGEAPKKETVKTPNEKKEEVKNEAKSVVASESKLLDDIGVGPVKEVTLNDIDKALVDAGKVLFETKCTACHKIEGKLLGPELKGVIERRNPVWIMNMILNPNGMIKENAIAGDLFEKYNKLPMTDYKLKKEEARSILEYMRTF